jgi:hypothetical protein
MKPSRAHHTWVPHDRSRWFAARTVETLEKPYLRDHLPVVSAVSIVCT